VNPILELAHTWRRWPSGDEAMCRYAHVSIGMQMSARGFEMVVTRKMMSIIIDANANASATMNSEKTTRMKQEVMSLKTAEEWQLELRAYVPSVMLPLHRIRAIQADAYLDAAELLRQGEAICVSDCIEAIQTEADKLTKP